MAFKVNIIGIVAWVLVVVLLVGVGALGVLNQHQAGKTAGLKEAFLKVGTAAGVEGLTSEALADVSKLPEVVTQIQTALDSIKAELASASASLASAQTEATTAKAELSQRLQEQAAKTDALAKEQAEKAEATAKELAAKSEALSAVEKQKSELEKSLETLKAQMEADAVRMQAELEVAKQVAVQAEPVAPAEAPAVEETSVEESAVAENVVEEVEEVAPPEEEGRIVGQSQMFSLIRYSGADKTLFFRMLDKQTLTYRDVPPEAYDDLIAAGDMLDMRYRFKIQGVFKSIPPDSVVIRKYWKWHRRHKPLGEVRTIEVGQRPSSTGGN